MTFDLERKNREFKEQKARRDWIVDRVRYYINKANDLFGQSMGIPVIRYHHKGRAAGRAIYADYAVSFHSVLAAENGEDFDQTIGHEVAHLVAKRVFGCTGHGKGWKRVMKALGLRVERCHSYDMSNAKVRRQARYDYVCACPKENTHKISATIHNKIQRGYSYRCAHCKTTLLRITATRSAAETPKGIPANIPERVEASILAKKFDNIQNVEFNGEGYRIRVRGRDGFFVAEDLDVLKAQLPVLNRKGE